MMTSSNLRLHHRQVRRPRALKDSTGVDAHLTPCIRKVATVAHQPANFGKLAPRICGRDPMMRCQVNNCMRRVVKKGSMSPKRASGRSPTKVAKAAVISRLVLALRTLISNPMVRAADSASLDVVSEVGPAGLTSTQTRVAAGTSSRKSSSRFATNSALRKLIPVRLPPGRARVATRPTPTGSSGRNEDDGDGRGCRLGRERAICKCDDHCDLAAHQIGRKLC